MALWPRRHRGLSAREQYVSDIGNLVGKMTQSCMLTGYVYQVIDLECSEDARQVQMDYINRLLDLNKRERDTIIAELNATRERGR